jgi:hypothetical protein
MWESLRMFFIVLCNVGAIPKVCGKGGKQHHRFPGFP